ncbi:Nucleoside-diphosphate-sugar epimerase [Halogranum gelatinilyticum]|uniref:Nucleoside-diphosphate-sugar epimerase n=1 Tax=Halogranum gelatinilyticum TaxID=660521 RepID=A0A1G9PLV6_9EURY|nr:NAD(P)-dependent oxidoreductase [Halogranum gelatinilyticum]SDL99760.1 Nucleoside-diphosphate-sugar epimerase [Halogranum gelatinilyticum]
MSQTATVAVTGGNGQVGRGVIRELNAHGYRTVNVSRGRRSEAVADAYQQADLLDAGEVYGALAACAADAVVHLGMRPRPDDAPGHVTFESNVMTTYHVLEACENLDIDSVAIASSMSALGAGFDPDQVRLDYLPVDETHPVDPRDPYALGKRVLEVTADGVGRRNDGPTTVATVRFPMAMDDEQIEEVLVDGDRSLDAIREAPFHHSAHNTLFAYVHLDDLARLFRLCVEADFDGHETVWAAAADTTVDLPTNELVAEEYPEADVRVEPEGFDEYGSLVDTTKAGELLGWTPEKSWRD